MKTPKKGPVVHDVVAALLAEHRYVERLLDVLEQQLDLASRGVAIDREAVGAVMRYMTEYPDAYHHRREDAMFVRLAERDPALRKRIAAIERAHGTIAASGKRLVAALQREPHGARDRAALASRVRDYVSVQREHMAIEERELFPRARQLLDDADLAAIERDFRRATDPLFEASVRDAYAAYPALVRMLVEQPAFSELLDVLEAYSKSASALGEMLFGAVAANVAPAGGARGKRRAPENSPTNS